MTDAAEDIDVSELEEIERIAVELATLAGAEIQAALGSMIAVRYKGEVTRKDAVARSCVRNRSAR